jgi:hypothetical protein
MSERELSSETRPSAAYARQVDEFAREEIRRLAARFEEQGNPVTHKDIGPFMRATAQRLREIADRA